MKADKRAVVPEDKHTIRDNVILYLVNLFDGKVEGEDPIWFDPDNTTLGPLFDISRRGTLEDIRAPQMTPGCAIEEGDEEETRNMFPFTDKKFRIFINFKVIKEVGVDVYALLNYYLGRIEQTLIRPEVDGLHLADLTISVEYAGNSLQINGDSDPEPGATAMYDIEYRHVLGDPFTENYNG